MKRLLTILLHLALTLAFVGYIAYQFRLDPVGPISGKRMIGEAAAYPADWGFTEALDHFTVETRPGSPHSVTTVAFTHNGALYIPAFRGSAKRWPGYAVADPRVRIKAGAKVYAARLTRAQDADRALEASLLRKYPQHQWRAEAQPRDLWLFRVSPR